MSNHHFPNTAQIQERSSMATEERRPLRRKTSPTYRTLRSLHLAPDQERQHTSSPAEKTAIQHFQSEEALRQLYERQLLLYLNSCYDDLEDIKDASEDE